MQNKLQGGGFSKAFAKFVATEFHGAIESDKIDKSGQDFAPERLQVFKLHLEESGQHTPLSPGAAHRAPPPILKHVVDTLSQCSTTLKDRIGVLASTMASKPAWGGAMTKLEYEVEWDKWPLGGAQLSQAYPESTDSPWLVCSRQFTFRCGPAVYPLAGNCRGCLCCHGAMSDPISKFGFQTLCANALGPLGLDVEEQRVVYATTFSSSPA
jgi:hypothetical protein